MHQPSVRPEATVVGTLPLAEMQRPEYFPDAHPHNSRPCTNRTHFDDSGVTVRKYTCTSPWCKQLNVLLLEVDALRQKPSAKYIPTDENLAN